MSHRHGSKVVTPIAIGTVTRVHVAVGVFLAVAIIGCGVPIQDAEIKTQVVQYV